MDTEAITNNYIVSASALTPTYLNYLTNLHLARSRPERERIQVHLRATCAVAATTEHKGLTSCDVILRGSCVVNATGTKSMHEATSKPRRAFARQRQRPAGRSQMLQRAEQSRRLLFDTDCWSLRNPLALVGPLSGPLHSADWHFLSVVGGPRG